MINNAESLNLDLVEKRYGEKYIDDVCFARSIALEIDNDPLSMEKFKDAPTITKLCKDRDNSTLERTKMAEAIAYGDANVFLACPNPSLAAGLIREIASDEHKDYFFDFIEKMRCTTFAGITEPQHGSDVASIEAKLEKINENSYCLTGEKCFITHGFDGKIAVALARTSPGPLGITPIMITYDELLRGQEEGTVQRNKLPIVGLKGTSLSQLLFDKFVISSWNLLGQHLRPIHRGMLAIIKTFNLMRPCVAGFVVGQTQGIVDYVQHCCKPISGKLQTMLNRFNLDIACVRENLYESAKIMDENSLESSCVSLAKAQATELAEKVCTMLTDEFDISVLHNHPLLLKWFRDIYGFEYMEGTTDMQKRNIYKKHLKKVC